jgi:lipoprotein NlpD
MSLACVGLGACTSTLVDYSVPTVHVVAPGETLYAIAWRHGVDYQMLAQWNGLDNPDLLFVGQRLRLRPAAEAPPARPAPEPVVSRPRVNAAASVRWSWPTNGTVLRRFGDRGGLSNGIGIGGTVGQEIRSAAAGRVVYAGSGLQAYGQLVIINHNDQFLSAYGYNERLFVAQGDEVGSGQRIAAMGLGPERRPQLHFEIRRNGTPVDPLSYLSAQ